MTGFSDIEIRLAALDYAKSIYVGRNVDASDVINAAIVIEAYIRENNNGVNSRLA